MYAFAQSLDFLAGACPGLDPGTKNIPFPNRKLQVSHPVLPDGH
jgi:hypothetical protein